jgi:hypothetical protein
LPPITCATSSGEHPLVGCLGERDEIQGRREIRAPEQPGRPEPLEEKVDERLRCNVGKVVRRVAHRIEARELHRHVLTRREREERCEMFSNLCGGRDVGELSGSSEVAEKNRAPGECVDETVC